MYTIVHKIYSNGTVMTRGVTQAKTHVAFLGCVADLVHQGVLWYLYIS